MSTTMDSRELGFRDGPCSWLGLCITEPVVGIILGDSGATYDLTVEGKTAEVSDSVQHIVCDTYGFDQTPLETSTSIAY